MLQIVDTADGSKTLYHPVVGEHYHSRHGAVQESAHVFVGMGLRHYLDAHHATGLSVLEIGFGAGLNFLLSADHCFRHGQALDYVGVEAFPLGVDMLMATGYGAYVAASIWESMLALYQAAQRESQRIVGRCDLAIAAQDVMAFNTDKRFDVMYFDAFAAVHQPELWTEETLRHVCQYLKRDGVFVTYAITGHLKRTLKGLGFTIEKLPGAPGKREMLRATKID